LTDFFFFFFCKYLVFKNKKKFRALKTKKKKSSHRDEGPLICCKADIIVVNKAFIGDPLSTVTFQLPIPTPHQLSAGRQPLPA
jgi:hypothetical protein